MLSSDEPAESGVEVRADENDELDELPEQMLPRPESSPEFELKRRDRCSQVDPQRQGIYSSKEDSIPI